MVAYVPGQEEKEGRVLIRYVVLKLDPIVRVRP